MKAIDVSPVNYYFCKICKRDFISENELKQNLDDSFVCSKKCNFTNEFRYFLAEFTKINPEFLKKNNLTRHVDKGVKREKIVFELTKFILKNGLSREDVILTIDLTRNDVDRKVSQTIRQTPPSLIEMGLSNSCLVNSNQKEVLSKWF